MMGAQIGWVFKVKQSVSFMTHFSKNGNGESYIWFKDSKKVKIDNNESGESKVRTLTMKNSTISSKDGEILIPIRDAIDALGKSISWDSKTNKITIIGKIDY